VTTQISKLRERFGLKEVVLVGDRGMLTQAHIEQELRPVRGLEWITALRTGESGVTPIRWTVLGCGTKSSDDKFSRSQWVTDNRWPNGGDEGCTILQ
jgi:hypothetical protein